jgi:internalin A
MVCEPDRSPRSWRRFLRFGVRGLIVLVFVIGAGLGWIVREARSQREAVAAIKNAGGTVIYDWEFNNGKPLPGGKPWAPKWLVNLVGIDYFGHVTAAVAHDLSAVTSDEVIAHVGLLTRIESLILHHSAISDAGLVHLKGLINLSTLWVDSTLVTDTGLVHLKGLTRLSYLWLSDTRVTDAGLAHLNGLTGLSSLVLSNTPVTDAGLAHLKGLTKLTALQLGGTQVTEAGAKELKRALPGLRIMR